ncbi:SDR family NAD(P)-dependent oxidoreductase [Cupriavidus necator]|uniref:SDR family NAD(P)-dependent oxidoreductase n=1 Tax=Cupriavidus necator TaxID=106590 RepID=UPI00339D7A93
MKISGNVFIVTGGGSGLGAATVKALAQQGATVVIVDLDVTRGQAVASETGGVFWKTDVSDEANVKEMYAFASGLGKLRGLVNCAGIAPAEKVIGKSGIHALSSFMRTMQINVGGTFNLLRLAADIMASQDPVETGERGVIINTASIAAFDGQIGQAAYAASKGAIVSMTLPLARELARFGIRVMTIAPGIMETPMLLAMPPEVQKALGDAVPFPPRMGKPDEFAGLVEYILGNAYLNGDVIRLDGAIRMPPK